jgi:hypothetical protein
MRLLDLMLKMYFVLHHEDRDGSLSVRASRQLILASGIEHRSVSENERNTVLNDFFAHRRRTL